MSAKIAKDGTLSIAKLLKLAYLSYFSLPAVDRAVYRAIRKNKVSKIVECGIGTTLRSQRMIESARLVSPDKAIYFTGIDLFEARSSSDGPGVSLKLGHRRLYETGARVKLVPGDPLSAFARSANMLAGTDLLVISAICNRAAMAEAWFFIPRILHAASVVIEEEILPGGRRLLKAVPLEEIAKRADQVRSKRAA